MRPAVAVGMVFPMPPVTGPGAGLQDNGGRIYNAPLNPQHLTVAAKAEMNAGSVMSPTKPPGLLTRRRQGNALTQQRN